MHPQGPGRMRPGLLRIYEWAHQPVRDPRHCGMLGGMAGLRARRVALQARVAALVRAIEEDDEALVRQLVRLSRSRRWLAPLAFTIGAFAMLIDGLRLLLSNWRLTLIQILPAMWIWLAMFDLRARVLHGRSFPSLRGPVLIPLGLAIVAITMACFFLNAVFAFAIAGRRPPRIRPAFAAAGGHIVPILAWGAAVGAPLAVGVILAPRWGKPWFALCLGAVTAVMMVCYVAVPSRLIGARPAYSRRDKLTAGALGAALGTTVCTPPYLLGRIGILMLGSKILFVPGIVVLTVGVTLQAGATGAVRAVKLSARLTGDPTRATALARSNAERPHG